MSKPDHSGTDSIKRPRELTLEAIVLGVILSVVMGAANVYLGLKVGMTVSASIPAAVIAMGILRGVMRRTSTLESNLVQTSASAGESLAAGIIFTMPALILIGAWDKFDFWTTSLIALAGGLLGVLLMIPMRRVFIVDNKELKYPEGVACAEVLRAGEGEAGGSGLAIVVGGLTVGALFKIAVSFLGLFRGTVEIARVAGGRVLFMGADISPALLAVGFIVGLEVASQVFIGGAIGWLITIPLLGDMAATNADGESLSAIDQAWTLWSTKVRYVGVGAMVVGGVASIWRVRGGLAAAVGELAAVLTGRQRVEASQKETERNLPTPAILVLTLVCVGLISALYWVLLDSTGLTLLATAAMIVMSFFIAAVASYIVGLVGNSNSPVSGMTITAVLGTGLMITLFGFGGEAGMIATLGVAGVVCCVACTSGDVCNDLKTGHLVGASPRSQQIMQVIGVVVAAFVMAPVLTVLHEGYGGIGSKSLPAPQAGLFASLTEGFFNTEKPLPMNMVYIGAGIGVALLIGDFILKLAKAPFRLHVMPVAVGIYLPFGLAIPILIGGIMNFIVTRGRKANAEKSGVLLASGIIAGESLIGVGIGLVAYLHERFEWIPGIDNHYGSDLLMLVGLPENVAGHIVSVVSVVALLFVASLIFRIAAAGADGDDQK
ncbi:MAG: oligopeptide transporter, OPT family [Pirellulaceae bacterium]|jgi:putative OPT family oligopeptide transporter|nr:oligopeptide transporter, OPT family [Pirellulaceae bacterium]